MVFMSLEFLEFAKALILIFTKNRKSSNLDFYKLCIDYG